MAVNKDGYINVDAIMDSVASDIAFEIVMTASDLLTTLQKATPYRTGRARRSWRAGVDEYTTSSITEQPPYVGGVEIEMTTGQHNRFLSNPRKGKVLSSFDPRKNRNIVISSDVPYMAKLNRGLSKQAPPGFIEACIDEVMVRRGLI